MGLVNWKKGEVNESLMGDIKRYNTSHNKFTMQYHHHPFSIQRSLLAIPGIVHVLEDEYAIAVRRCRLIKSVLCDTYEVTTPSDRYIFRVYPHGPRSSVEIRNELKFILHLSNSGISVSTPVARRGGDPLLPIPAPEGERQGVLFTYADGAPLHHLNDLEATRAFGRLSARIHMAADRLPFDLDLPVFDTKLLLDQPLARMEQIYDHRTDVLAHLRDVAADIKHRIESTSKERPYFGLCHGDLNRSNVHYSLQDGLTLFDFEYCNYGWRAFDLATLINTESDDHIQAYLNGYETVRAMDDAERSTLPVFQVAQKIWMLGTGASHADAIGIGWMTDRFLDSQMEIIKAAYARVVK